MISVPAVVVTGIDGSPDAIRSLATSIGGRQGQLEDRAAHVRAAVAVLEGNHGKHVAQLRTRADRLPPRQAALGRAYVDVKDILTSYAGQVAILQQEATRLESQVQDDTYRLGTARQSCLASDPTFPGQNLPWDFAPSPYTAPNMTYLGQWHGAINDVTCGRQSLEAIAARRKTLDEQTAARLRDVTVDGPGVKDWLHQLAPAGALTVAGVKGTLKTLKVKGLAALVKDFRAANKAFRANDTPANEAALANAKALLRTEAEGRGVPAKGLLSKVGLMDNPGLIRVLTPVGKVLGPVGAGYAVYSGVHDAISPEHQGLRGWGDRGAGIATAVGGGAALLVFAGVVAAPVAGPIIIGAAVVAGAWALGSTIYDHWDDITGFASKAWKGYTHVNDVVTQAVTKAAVATGRELVDEVTHPVKALGKAASFVGGLFS